MLIVLKNKTASSMRTELRVVARTEETKQSTEHPG